MEDGRINIRATLDINEMERNAELYRKELARMGTVTDKEGKVISTAWERTQQAIKKNNAGRVLQEMTGDVSENIAIQKKVLSELEQQYKEVSKAVENAAPGNAKNKLQAEMASIKKEIDGEKQALQELEQVQNQYKQSNTSLRTQLMNIRNEMGQLELAGQRNSERYQELESELGRLGTAYRKLEYEQKAFSTGATQWGGIISGIQGVAGAFTAAQGVIGMFVTDNEKLVKIQTRLQAVMAITIGMQQVSNTLHETSAFRMTTVRRVTELYSAAQTKLATSLGISTVAAKALMASLTLGLSVAITAVIALISRWQSAQAKAAEEQKKIVDAQKSAAESMAGQLTSFKKLQKGWNELGDNLEEKKKYITENKDEMDKLGISVNNVRDAENLFVLHGGDFIKALFAKTQAIASMEIATEKYKEALINMTETEGNALENIRNEIIKQKGATVGEALFEEIKPLLDDRDGYGKIIETLRKNGIENGIGYGKVFTENIINYQQAVKVFEEQGNEVERFLKEQSDSFKKYGDILQDAGLKTTEKDRAQKEAEKEAEEKERKVAEARKKVLEKINEEFLSLERENQQSRIDLMEEGTNKNIKQIELDFNKQKEIIDKKAKEFAEANEKIGSLDLNINGLTQEQQAKIDEANRINTQKREKAERDVYKAEAVAMREYLKEYGTFQQKKLAIAQEYAEKIKNAQNEGERLKFEKQRDRDIHQVEIDALKQKIDWESVFGDVSGILGSQLKETLGELRKYVETDDFRNSSESDKKVIYDAIDKLRGVTPGGEGTLNFKKIQEQMDNLGVAINRYQSATNSQIFAQENLTKATDNYNNALATGNKDIIQGAEEALLIAQSAKKNADEAYNNAFAEMQNLGEDFRMTSTDTIDGLNLVADGLHGFASNTLLGIFKGLQSELTGLSKLNIKGKVGEAVNSLSKSLSSAGFVGQLISAILSILDILKDGIGPLVSGIIDSILGAINGILDNLLSGDIFVQIFDSIKGGIGKILNTITFGGFNSWISSSNAKEVAEVTERLTNSNNRLKDSVDSLKDEISKTGGWKAIDAAKQAEKDQEKINNQTMEILKTQMGYHGSHHSNAYYWGLNRGGYNSINKSLADYAKKAGEEAFKVGNLDDIYKLTPEQMDYIRTYNIEMWEKMLDQGKYDKSEYWEEYADLAGKLSEITESLKETLTQISFDSLRSSFIDSLMDMNKSAEDFANDFQEYLMRSVLNAKISDMLDKELKDFYDNWSEYAESGNEITKDEQNLLNKQWDEITQKGLAIRDQVAAFTGYNNSSAEEIKAQTGAISDKITEETASAMMGIWRGQYDSTKAIENTTSSLYADWKNAINITNNYLSAIADNTGQTASNTAILSTVNDTLSRMDGRLKTLEGNSSRKYI